ncbi:hypothetical protein IWZ03DRAFT_50368 [Phyllosticta citriasiana]|uniref:T. brucei spp.-specific protein n=1 Tax=Phyllosticta citriasiana TaxID=595635 RepID=A0ABR1KC36_9PEZI
MVTDLKVRIACGLVPSLPHSTSYAPTSHTPVIHPSRVVPGLVFFFFLPFFFPHLEAAAFIPPFFCSSKNRRFIFVAEDSSIFPVHPFCPTHIPTQPPATPTFFPLVCVLCVCVYLLAFFLFFFFVFPFFIRLLNQAPKPLWSIISRL